MDSKPSRPTRRELTHDRIVEVASRAIRRGGYAGVGVADIMKEAGLTHGGFYAHFDSRNAMLAEAVERAGRDSAAAIEERMAARQAKGASALRAIIDGYLSDTHLGALEQGCVVAALSSEMPRQAPEVRAASIERVQGLIARVRKALPAGVAADQAAVIASSLVGALQLARTLGVEAGGPALLRATRQSLLARYDSGSPST